MSEYVSRRAIEEAERRVRIETFDKFVDLALDGVIEERQAFKAYIEETGVEPKDPSYAE